MSEIEVQAESPPDAGTFYIPRIYADEVRAFYEAAHRVAVAMLLNGWGTEQALMECYA